WQAAAHRGAEVRDEPGAAAWMELGTRDPAKAEAFYTGLLGWTADTFTRGPVPYTLFLRDGQPVAGMLRLAASMQGVPPHWMPFFAVAGVDEALGRAEQMGAVRLVGPEPLAGIGRFATLQDPQGAAFSILQRTSG
ncbi:MAG TPA: VOC family protein, partial [Longimicrobium sp.]|uniref:VOC family protein n=1 Tax=Longimicrobium sp. TaxID=2029185 RepID=UPI002EDA4556